MDDSRICNCIQCRERADKQQKPPMTSEDILIEAAELVSMVTNRVTSRYSDNVSILGILNAAVASLSAIPASSWFIKPAGLTGDIPKSCE